MKKNPFNNLVLDAEEQELEDNFDNLSELPPAEAAVEHQRLTQAVINTLNKNKTIGVRINEGLLIKITNIAKHDGLKVSTLINSLIYRYAQERAQDAYSP